MKIEVAIPVSQGASAVCWRNCKVSNVIAKSLACHFEAFLHVLECSHALLPS
jgi:hypothetical protein